MVKYIKNFEEYYRVNEMDQRLGDAYWLSPQGKIFVVDAKHINFIRDNLEMFKLTREDYTGYYDKYHEKYGFEGKAREDILIYALKLGWIRLRDYKNKGWSIEVWELDKFAKNLIFDWAAKVLGLIKEDFKNTYNNNEVIIHVIKLEKAGKPQSEWLVDTNLREIVQGSLFENVKNE